MPQEPFDESEQVPPLVAPPDAEGRCPPIRVLTFNAFSITFHENHEELTRLGAAAVVAERADIVAIQEVWHTHDATVYADALRAAGLVHQIEHTTNSTLARGSSGLLLASRFPIVEERFVPFRCAAAPYWMWPPDWYANKGVIETVLATDTGLLRVLNTHLHAEYEPGGYLRERLGQSMELASLIRERADLPLLILGDMNSQTHEVSHVVITQGTGAEVLARSDVDLVLARDGERGVLHVDSARFAVVQRVQLRSGVRSRLSDHAGLFASLEHCPTEPHLQSSQAQSSQAQSSQEAVGGYVAVLQQAIHAARLHGEVARGTCAGLGVLVLLWMSVFLRRRRWPSSYQTTPLLVVLWLVSWAAYHGWLAAPEQLAAYAALLPQ